MKDKTGKTLTYQEIQTKTFKRLGSIFFEFEIMFLHLIGMIPSHLIRLFFYRLAGMRIGNGSRIHMGARFYNLSKITIGRDTIIGEGVVLDGRERLSIGNHVAFASDVMVYNAKHSIHDEDFHAVTEPVIIEDYVFVGPRAIILPGITVKKGAVIAAGAVVTNDVPERAIVGGVPAIIIGERKVSEFHYRLGRAAWFR